MIPQIELEALLQSRLSEKLSRSQIEQLARDIVSLEGGWEEMSVAHRDMGYSHSELCSSICWIADQTENGSVIKLFRKKK